MKQWKLIVVTLLAVLMVCVCTSAMADHTHKPGNYTVVTEATCAKEGKAVYNRCTVEGCELNEEIVFVLPKSETHTGKIVGYKAKEATCTEDGYTYYEKCNECGEIVKGKEVKPATGHTEVEKGVRKAATCTEEGIKVYWCSVCNEELRTEAIPMTEHAWKKIDYSKGTCTEKSYYIFKCEGCGATKNDEYGEIDATNHVETEHVYSQEPTCTEDGNTWYDYCVACGVVTAGEKKVLPAAHTWKEDTKHGKPATCTEDGYTFWYCDVPGCGATEKRTVKSNGAHMFDWKKHVKPGCETEGYG